MGIQIDSDFIRLWDSNNPTGIRIEAMGGPRDKLRITGQPPIEITHDDYKKLSLALIDFSNCGFFNGAY